MEKKKNGTILGGPTMAEIKEAQKSGTIISFAADNESGEISMQVKDFTDLNMSKIDRWKVVGVIPEDASITVVVYYSFPLLKGLYLYL
jgi:hypothetical protein